MTTTAGTTAIQQTFTITACPSCGADTNLNPDDHTGIVRTLCCGTEVCMATGHVQESMTFPDDDGENTDG